MKTVFLVGSGAVKRNSTTEDDSSWPIIESALKKVYEKIGHTVPVGDSNFVMASLVFQMRFLRYLYCRNGSENSKKLLDEVSKRYEAVIESIRKTLDQAQRDNMIFLRPEFDEKIKPFRSSGQECLITTNWDTLLNNFFSNGSEILHIHRSISQGDPLLLPSEMVHEPYRSPKEVTKLKKTHSKVLDELSKADRIVVYGVSFSPLDAEIGLIVGESLRENNPNRNPNQSIVVIDKKPFPVISRLRYFDSKMQITPIQI